MKFLINPPMNIHIIILLIIVSSCLISANISPKQKQLNFEEVAGSKISLKELPNGYRGVYANASINVHIIYIKLILGKRRNYEDSSKIYNTKTKSHCERSL
jgi:hypothetical protein